MSGDLRLRPAEPVPLGASTRMRPATRFFINDVGQNTWEEIDNGQAGADYGWNVREGHCANGSTTNCGAPPTGMTNPIYDYGRGNRLLLDHRRRVRAEWRLARRLYTGALPLLRLCLRQDLPARRRPPAPGRAASS